MTRLAALRAMFRQREYEADLVREQTVPHKHKESGENLICPLSEDDKSGTILVIAHYQHEGDGMGVIDNWSGAVMLPFLYYSLRATPRQHQYIFVALDGQDGVERYLHSLNRKQKHAIRAVIALDSLGVDDLHYFSSANFMEPVLPQSLGLQLALIEAAFLHSSKPLPTISDTQHWIGLDDTTEFRRAYIPVITVHSISASQSTLPRSKDDTLAAIDMDKYYETYKTLCIYLSYLDLVADKLTEYNKILPSKEHE